MEKVIVIYGMPDDPEHFRKYYVERHVPLVERMPFLIDYRYSFDVQSSDSAAFCIFEASFPDREKFLESMESEAGKEAAADTQNYASGGLTIVHYAI